MYLEFGLIGKHLEITFQLEHSYHFHYGKRVSRDAPATASNTLTCSRWSVIVGLIICVALGVVSYIFAPKGENQTYVNFPSVTTLQSPDRAKTNTRFVVSGDRRSSLLSHLAT